MTVFSVVIAPRDPTSRFLSPMSERPRMSTERSYLMEIAGKVDESVADLPPSVPSRMREPKQPEHDDNPRTWRSTTSSASTTSPRPTSRGLKRYGTVSSNSKTVEAKPKGPASIRG